MQRNDLIGITLDMIHVMPLKMVLVVYLMMLLSSALCKWEKFVGKAAVTSEVRDLLNEGGKGYWKSLAGFD